jgi:hypothetical protein
MDVILTLLILLWLIKRRKNKQEIKKVRKIRRFKSRPVFRNRQVLGEMNLMKQIYALDDEMFHKCFRMNVQQFDYLLSRLSLSISPKQEQSDSISARQRLAMTIRYVGTIA